MAQQILDLKSEYRHVIRNNKEVLDKLANDAEFGNAILGGQNPYAMLAEGAELVDMSNISPGVYHYYSHCGGYYQTGTIIITK